MHKSVKRFDSFVGKKKITIKNKIYKDLENHQIYYVLLYGLESVKNN